MLPLKKYAVIPLIIAILAFVIQSLDQFLSPYLQPEGNVGFSWISFQSWGLYFLAGCNLKGGIKSFLGYAVGIIAAILIMETANLATPIGFWAVPAAVAIIAFFAIFLERTVWLSLLPAIFIGAGVFFGFMNYIPGATYCNAFISEMIYATIGLLFGFITVVLRTKYENSLKINS